ncbi:MAG: nucleotide pyrophosphohydrolase [Candidatus Infernicultor aquiphilus]|uniref:Nucleotide pyrophosphohydrolase n=1 Tax=Candidatus Infernicultor aquiphilus TaxID=1805029 RepID=A0A1J5GIR0_9BACT|nr:nucleotide pyrophosphohydrolase [bacterium]OIP72156.1 MAG: nucleotide pyrophosphohydrolase [Candidatus Atribacteria bacterium CG2_30_33_13]PIU24987.1 MAG: nucleotide pyrophosphohydrolase [Candidatus Atribacteria bacterium CG08_land_8_20_14_0_20_33_29]PIW11246.1 MAG: nucleotide pyrophosphohydrolase [Candidatus Atribacteria bacterium CG17_big_fil_post_rev_8_21_14_2_50_34_11]PIX33568.1 MAG: nucleotide pyrophosphohydrolase [Candidatus Atribacteria bacterium CG_4_8_14_3_um_filter_34_18]PIY31383.
MYQEYQEEKKLFTEMMNIIAKLRGPEGCLWDRKQTLESLTTNILEEAKEISEAVKSQDIDNLREELGDLLMVIFMEIETAREKGLFSYSEVLAGAIDKFVRRHPHVFGDLKVNTPEEALAVWEKMKTKEKEINN